MRYVNFTQNQCCQSQVTKYVRKYIENGPVCYANSVRPANTGINLLSIPKVIEPFDTLHIDHFRPLEKTPRRNHLILVVVDTFTKFICLFPVRSVTTTKTLVTLREVFRYYGKPSRNISGSKLTTETNHWDEFVCSTQNVINDTIQASTTILFQQNYYWAVIFASPLTRFARHHNRGIRTEN